MKSKIVCKHHIAGFSHIDRSFLGPAMSVIARWWFTAFNHFATPILPIDGKSVIQSLKSVTKRQQIHNFVSVCK